MALFDRIFMEGAKAGSRGRSTVVPSGRYEVDIDTFGIARSVVTVGDMDGSGEQPGVQLEIEHQFTDGPKVIAYDAREAELVARALWMAANEIAPHERLRQRRAKWHREMVPTQPHPSIDKVDSVDLTKEEVEAVMRTTDPALAGLRERLGIPF